VEAGLAAALADEEIEEVPGTAGEDEAESPRRRARRRTRSWKRLHSTESAEEGDLAETSGEGELTPTEAGAATDDLETLDELFGDAEETAAEATETSGEEEPRRRRRRRRRRSRRGERAEEGAAAGEAESGELEDEELEESAALDDEADEEEEFMPRERPRRRAAATAEEPDDEGDELDDGEEGGRPAHRKIPTWDEAVGIVIANNMEARAKSPGGGRRRR
jgi:hypothetical protein